MTERELQLLKENPNGIFQLEFNDGERTAARILAIFDSVEGEEHEMFYLPISADDSAQNLEEVRIGGLAVEFDQILSATRLACPKLEAEG